MLGVLLLHDAVGGDGVVDDAAVLGRLVAQRRRQRRRRRARPALLKLRLQLLVRLGLLVQRAVRLHQQGQGGYTSQYM